MKRYCATLTVTLAKRRTPALIWTVIVLQGKSQSSKKKNLTTSSNSCSMPLNNGENAEEWGRQESERYAKRGAGREKEKRKGERACNHFFYDPLPPTFGAFEIIRFRLSNI